MQLILTWSLLPLGVLLLASLLLRFALKGRRIDNHPICRRCNYDLFGHPITAETICPECGTKIATSKAFRIGRREKHRPLVAFAAILILSSLTALAFLGRTSYLALQNDTNKPTWWLIHETHSPNQTTRDTSLAELLRRVSLAELSPSQIEKTADQILTLQTDLSQNWNQPWGDFIEIARAQKLLDDAHWCKYAEQALALRLACREKIRHGDQLPFEFSEGPARTGSKVEYYAYYEMAISIDGEPLTHFIGPLPQLISATGSSMKWADLREMNLDLFDSLKDGAHALDISFTNADGDPILAQNAPRLSAPAFHRTLPFTIVPAGTQTVELATDPALQSQVAKQISVTGIERGPGHWTALIKVDKLPIDLAADVIIITKDRRLTAVPIKLKAGKSETVRCIIPDLPQKEYLPQADVILRHNIDLASNTLTMTRIWSGELTFKNVPIIIDPNTNPLDRP